jgi:hypothetical protein
MKTFISPWVGILLLFVSVAVATNLFMTWRDSDKEAQFLVREPASSQLHGKTAEASIQSSLQRKMDEPDHPSTPASQTPASLEPSSVPFIAHPAGVGERSLQDRPRNATSISSEEPGSTVSPRVSATFSASLSSAPGAAVIPASVNGVTAIAAPAPAQPPIPTVFASQAAATSLPQEQQAAVVQSGSNVNPAPQVHGAAPSSPEDPRVISSPDSLYPFYDPDSPIRPINGIDAWNALQRSTTPSTNP